MGTCCTKRFLVLKRRSCSVLLKSNLSCWLQPAHWSCCGVEKLLYLTHLLIADTLVNCNICWYLLQPYQGKNALSFCCGSAESSIASSCLHLASWPLEKKSEFSYSFPFMFWFSDWLPPLVSPLLHLCWVPVVFMGSEKYPSENGFDAFLKKHGGSDNASTDCERTVFQFDVQRKSFKEALDRWGRMFVCFPTSWEVDFSSRWFRFWSTLKTAKKEKKTKKSTKPFRHYCSQLSQAFHKPVGKLGVNSLRSSQQQLASFKLTTKAPDIRIHVLGSGGHGIRCRTDSLRWLKDQSAVICRVHQSTFDCISLTCVLLPDYSLCVPSPS